MQLGVKYMRYKMVVVWATDRDVRRQKWHSLHGEIWSQPGVFPNTGPLHWYLRMCACVRVPVLRIFAVKGCGR